VRKRFLAVADFAGIPVFLIARIMGNWAATPVANFIAASIRADLA
jgi:hypothetical protein